MPQRIVFLDFDGVIAPAKNCEYPFPVSIDPDCVLYLNTVTGDAAAGIVVTSQKRIGKSAGQLAQILHGAGIDAPVIGVTPDLPDAGRGTEIRTWLDAHPDVESFVILDDEDFDTARRFEGRIVLTDPFEGLRGTDVQYALMILHVPYLPRGPATDAFAENPRTAVRDRALTVIRAVKAAGGVIRRESGTGNWTGSAYLYVEVPGSDDEFTVRISDHRAPPGGGYSLEREQRHGEADYDIAPGGMHWRTAVIEIQNRIRESLAEAPVEDVYWHLWHGLPEPGKNPPRSRLLSVLPGGVKPWTVPEDEYVRLAAERRLASAVRNRDGWRRTADDPKRSGAARRNADHQADLWQAQIDRLSRAADANVVQDQADYRLIVRKALSTGQAVPPEIIAQSPEFAKALDARRRYEKGRHTSFGNISSAVDASMLEAEGYKVKRQDGRPIGPDEVEEIVSGFRDVASVLGPDLRRIVRANNLTIVHTGGKHPFLRKSGGLHVPGERVISVGVRTGFPVARNFPAMAHELAHFVDRTVHPPSGPYSDLAYDARWKINRLYDAGRVQKARLGKIQDPKTKADVARVQLALGPYWREPREIWARLVEQYVANRLNRPSFAVELPGVYAELPGYWTQADFDALAPRVEEELERQLFFVLLSMLKEAEPCPFPVPSDPTWPSSPPSRYRSLRPSGSGTSSSSVHSSCGWPPAGDPSQNRPGGRSGRWRHWSSSTTG
ncbi:MAG: HAD domain-containing protein [Candidatus Bipolaricaulota bacterium]